MTEQISVLVIGVAGVLVAVLLMPLCLTVARMLMGPSAADRFVALDMLTGIAVAAAALVSVVAGRREFLDVALGLALFGFVGTTALGAFLVRQRRDEP